MTCEEFKHLAAELALGTLEGEEHDACAKHLSASQAASSALHLPTRTLHSPLVH